MSKICESCATTESREPMKLPESVPGAIYEMEMARAERHSKRWMIAFFVALAMLFSTNVGWIIYESQFDTYYYAQGDSDVNNMNVDVQGDVYNGATSENQEETQPQS
ncbi:MAG: hypothetical protein J6S71_02955 [Clostridia bacterium]|nr:hypothetical protein [Clostridia bacterium]